MEGPLCLPCCSHSAAGVRSPAVECKLLFASDSRRSSLSTKVRSLSPYTKPGNFFQCIYSIYCLILFLFAVLDIWAISIWILDRATPPHTKGYNKEGCRESRQFAEAGGSSSVGNPNWTAPFRVNEITSLPAPGYNRPTTRKASVG